MPGMAGAAYGFAGMGPYAGGQAEYLRVPYADFNCLKFPDDAVRKRKGLRDAGGHLPDGLAFDPPCGP